MLKPILRALGWSSECRHSYEVLSSTVVFRTGTTRTRRQREYHLECSRCGKVRVVLI